MTHFYYYTAIEVKNKRLQIITVKYISLPNRNYSFP